MFVRAIVWKEIREHRLQALLLVGMAAGVLFLLQTFEPDFSAETFRATLSAAFAWACGMVTGAILLANESESMTQLFLDHLPRSRRQLWWSKAFFGVMLTMVEAGALTAACVILRRGGGGSEPPPLILGMNLFGGLFGLSCGLFGSSLSGNVLSAIGWSVVALFGTLAYGVVLFFVLSFLGYSLGVVTRRSDAQITLLATIASLPMPMALSSWFYTGLDRKRAIVGGRGLMPRLGLSASGFGVRQMLWLSFKQGWTLQVFLAVGALIASILLTIEPLATWPAATLLIGLLAGVGVVGDEQFYGSFRLLAEQRLPLNRFWLIKIASRLAVAVLLAIAMILATWLGRELIRSFVTNGLPSNWQTEQWMRWVRQIGPVNFLIAPLIYGFAFGHLIGLFARKTFVAFAVGLVGALACLAAWTPSLVGGGLPAWQILAIPIGLVILARLSIWKWATDRLFSTPSLLLCAGAAALGVGFIGLAIGNRVWESPRVAPPFDVAEFEAGYPLRVENEIRAKLIEAGDAFQAQLRRHPQLFSDRLTPYSSNGAWNSSTRRDNLSTAIMTGWPKDEPELQQAVEAACAGEWLAILKKVAALPPSVIDDPRDLAISSLMIGERLRQMTPWVAGRALQLQAQGDQEGALNLISVLLSLARHAQSRSTLRSYYLGGRVEQTACQALENWSRDPKVTPALLERALQMLREHDASGRPYTDNVKAEYVYQRDFLAEITNPYTDRGGSDRDDWKRYLNVPANVAPWEKIRRDRLFNACFELTMQSATMTYPALLQRARSTESVGNLERLNFWVYQSLPLTRDNAGESLKLKLTRLLADAPLFQLVSLSNRGAEVMQFWHTCGLRAAEIRLALLVYQHRHGKPAETLAQLTPELLPSVPIDPYSERPFQYRLVTQEEWLPWKQPAFAGAEDWYVQDFAMTGAMGLVPPATPFGPAPAKFRPVSNLDESATYRRLKPGYGVIWSVGADGTDDGGISQSDTFEHPIRVIQNPRVGGGDMLFVVPRIK